MRFLSRVFPFISTIIATIFFNFSNCVSPKGGGLATQSLPPPRPRKARTNQEHAASINYLSDLSIKLFYRIFVLNKTLPLGEKPSSNCILSIARHLFGVIYTRYVILHYVPTSPSERLPFFSSIGILFLCLFFLSP